LFVYVDVYTRVIASSLCWR